MLRKSFPTISILLGVLPGSVLALGLGEIHAGSYLSQPLRAEIELVGVKAQEIDGVRANLAPEREFQKAGAARAPQLGELQFQPRISASGSPVIGVTSEQPVREPFLDFLVEVNWPQGRLVKEYTLLLDPPVTLPGIGPPPRLPATAPVGPRQASPSSPGTSRTAAAAPGPASALPRGGNALSYGPVRRGESLWRIAKRLKVPGASRQELIEALYRANPDAFAGGDVNRLRTGVVLRLGSPQRDAPVAVPDAPGATAGSPAGRVDRPGAEQPAQQDQLRILAPKTPDAAAGMAGESGAAGEGLGALHRDVSLVREETETARQETTQLQGRVEGLEGQLQDIRHLLDIRNAQIAQLQRDLLVPDSPPGAAPGEGATGFPAGLTQRATPEPPAALPAESDWLAGVRAAVVGALEGPSTLPVLVTTALVLSLLFLYLARRRQAAEPALAPADGATAPDRAPVTLARREFPAPPTPLPSPSDRREAEAELIAPPGDAASAVETDSLEDADVYLGFGRYREAEQLVRAALQREPRRIDLKVKLAEIYHGAGNAAAFGALLRELEVDRGGALPMRTLDRLLAMAESLGLGFAGAPSPPPAEAPIAAHLASTPAPRRPPREETAPAREAEAAGVGAPHQPEAPADQGMPVAAEGLDGGLDLDAALAEIEQVERARAQTATGARPPSPPGGEGPSPFEGLSLEPLPEQAKPPGVAESPPPEAQAGQPPGPSATSAPDPETRRRALRAETNLIKLDLARAYLAMDDRANARALLEEIIAEGEGAPREEAEDLLAALD